MENICRHTWIAVDKGMKHEKLENVGVGTPEFQ